MFFIFFFVAIFFYLILSKLRYWWSYVPPHIMFYNHKFDDSILFLHKFKNSSHSFSNNSIIKVSSSTFLPLLMVNKYSISSSSVIFGFFLSGCDLFSYQKKLFSASFHFFNLDSQANNYYFIYFCYAISNGDLFFSFPIPIAPNFVVPDNQVIKLVNTRMYIY